MQSSRSLVSLLLLALSAMLLASPRVDAFPTYVKLVPNGAGVKGVAALGHVSSSGGGATNAFGKAFAAEGAQWTAALCQADTDGDGATNGEELGDPCCTWKKGDAAPTAATTLTHPGVANPFTTAEIAALQCKKSGEDATSASSKAAATSASNATAATTSPSQTTAAPSSSDKKSAAMRPLQGAWTALVTAISVGLWLGAPSA